MTSEPAELCSWMNDGYFKLILTKFEGHDNFQINEFIVSSGTNKGENFASAIYRVNLNYSLNGESKKASFILKTNPESSALCEMLEEIGTFEGETNVYKNIIPECERTIPNFKIAPRLIHADKNALVLEDLAGLGYKLANRKNRFDLTRAKLVLEKVAKFHASTAAIYEKNSELMEPHLRSAIDSETETPLSFFFKTSLQETLKTIRNTPELHRFLPLLENYDIVEQEKRIFKRSDAEKFQVLIHGDLWINNIFFSLNDNGTPTDAILVDYQETFFGGPGIDLNHFLYTSCDLNVHTNHVDDLIGHYYKNLVAALKHLSYPKIPSLELIQEDFQRKSDQGLIALCSIVPVMMIENPEHANPENFIADGEGAAIIRRQVYGNPKFIDVLKNLLPKFTNR